MKTMLKEIKKLVTAMRRYGIKGPDQNRAFITTSTTSEVLTDQIIASHVLILIQEIVEMLLRSMRISITNNAVRTLIKDITKTAIAHQDTFYKYVKLKDRSQQACCTPPASQQ